MPNQIYNRDSNCHCEGHQSQSLLCLQMGKGDPEGVGVGVGRGLEGGDQRESFLMAPMPLIQRFSTVRVRGWSGVKWNIVWACFVPTTGGG